MLTDNVQHSAECLANTQYRAGLLLSFLQEGYLSRKEELEYEKQTATNKYNLDVKKSLVAILQVFKNGLMLEDKICKQELKFNTARV